MCVRVCIETRCYAVGARADAVHHIGCHCTLNRPARLLALSELKHVLSHSRTLGRLHFACVCVCAYITYVCHVTLGACSCAQDLMRQRHLCAHKHAHTAQRLVSIQELMLRGTEHRAQARLKLHNSIAKLAVFISIDRVTRNCSGGASTRAVVMLYYDVTDCS